MRIRLKILLTLLCMALLVALLGAFAIDRERTIGLVGVSMGAEDVACIVGFVYAADKDPAHALTQEIVFKLYKELGHDVEVITPEKQVVADAVKETSIVSKRTWAFDIDAALRDGEPRTFVETNAEFPSGSQQVVMPMKNDAGKVIGAVIMEYTPHYDVLMGLIASMTHQVIGAGLGSAIIALLLAFYMTKSIVRPLRQLTRAAAALATGQDYASLPARRGDEIGELTSAFNIMMERRRQALVALRRARDEMESRVIDRTAELAAANKQMEQEVIERRLAETTARQGEERVKQLAAEMDHEREHFAEILNSVPAVVFEHWPSDESTRPSFVSRRVEAMFGYTAEEWLSTPDFWCQQVHPHDREEALRAAARRFSGEGTGEEHEVCRWVTRDQRVIWGETRLSVIRNPADGTAGVRGFTLDVTDQIQAAEELKRLHQQLLDASRQAGMAEVATNVLHNVGNVLNSVNISAGLAAEQLHNSSAPHLARVAALMNEHSSDIAAYISTDAIGCKLPGFLTQLSGQLESEQKSILQELEHLVKNVEHIKDIVAVQQSYASVAGVSQSVDIVDLVEDSLRMNAGALMRHDVQLLREFEKTPPICVDKHKVMQVLVNLIRNAKYACDESGLPDKRLTVRISRDEAKRRVRVAIVDNGVGIPAENMTRIFSHGFTTRKTGHGFGLHSGALAAKEIGGDLLVESPGPGLGAVFTLEIPMEAPK